MAIDMRQLKRPSRSTGVPPLPFAPRGNLEKPPSGQKVPLQLTISPELRREFRAYAAERDLELSALCNAVWTFRSIDRRLYRVYLGLYIEACASIRGPFLSEMRSQTMKRCPAPQPLLTSYTLL